MNSTRPNLITLFFDYGIEEQDLTDLELQYINASTKSEQSMIMNEIKKVKVTIENISAQMCEKV